jgi:uncharacterized coiled-coil protein SlyX
MDLEPRMTELEIALAHQERLIGELNAVVIEQQTTIATLRAELDRLKEQVAQILAEEPLENARPPHY